jgi:hypothetical protein
VFEVESVLTWDEPLADLADEATVALYLRGRGLSVPAARDAARTVSTPLRLTKRGCVVWARHP